MSKLKKEDQATSVTGYLKARYKELYAPAAIGLDGKMYRWNGKRWVTQAVFMAKNPVPLVINFGRSKNNPDKRNSFMQ